MQRSAFVLALLLIGGGMIGATMMNAPQPSEAFAQAATATAPATAAAAPAAPGPAMPDNPGFYAGEAGLTPSERAGREIWYKATAGNARFHTYVFQQRIDVLIDWYRVLQRRASATTASRPGASSTIPAAACPAATAARRRASTRPTASTGARATTSCSQFVGREGYRDPACDFRMRRVDRDDPAPQGARTSASPPAISRSAPRPARSASASSPIRASTARWLKVNGSLASWDGYRGAARRTTRSRATARCNRLADGSIEPPFLIGTACGSCHIAFDPLNPPKDPAQPEVGEHQGRGRQPVLAHLRDPRPPGCRTTTLECADVRARAARDVRHVGDPDRPGAQPGHDERDHQHSAQRPDVPGRGRHQVAQGRRVRGSGDANCWCEPGATASAGSAARATETVHHILKGGEDSIGALEAIQRVYFNIGSCSEQCWVNHLTDLRQLDPQRPQLRPDAVRHRPVPARLPELPRDRGPSAEHPRLPVLEGDRRDRSRASRANALRKRRTPRRAYTHDDLDAISTGSSARVRSRAAARCSPRTARAATRASPRPRAARSRTATSARSTADRHARATGWATTRRRSSPRSAPTAAARCTRTT